MRFEALAVGMRGQIVPDVGRLAGTFLAASYWWAYWWASKRFRKARLHESCRELILDLPAAWVGELARLGTDDIERFRRSTVTWYHELRIGDAEYGFARSEGDGGLRVIEVVPSRVAKEFIDTVNWLDSFPVDLGCSPRDGQNALVQLLCVPRYNFYALAAMADERIDGVFPFFRKDHGLERKRGYSRVEFFGFLPNLRPFFGVEEDVG